MAITVQEFVEQFRQLDAEQQQEALALINGMAQGRSTDFDYMAWIEHVRAFRASLTAHYGPDYQTGALDLLEELREEESEWPFGG